MTSKQKKRIDILIPRLGITDRGAEIFVYELAKRLSKNCKVVIWTRWTSEESPIINDLMRHKVHVRSVSCLAEETINGWWQYIPKPIQRVLVRFRLDPFSLEMLAFCVSCLPKLLVAQSQVLLPVCGVWGAISARIVRYIKNTRFMYSSQGGIEPLIARQNPDVYVAIHPYTQKWLQSHFPHLKVVYIPNGVDLDRFTPVGEKAKMSLPRPVYVTVSALIVQKRVDLTIKAFAKLKKGSLLVIGSGPLQEELRILGLSLTKMAIVFIHVSHRDLPKYLRFADVFCFAAPSEKGWGNVHLEALATNLPVVANDEDNIRSLMGQVAHVCDVTDIDTYARVLEDASRVSKTSNSRNAVLQLSWDAIGKRYQKVIATL